MKKAILTLAILATSSVAMAHSFIITTLIPTVSSMCITGGCRNVVDSAKEDAAAFVASEGEIRGPQLQKALNFLRDLDPELRATDMELALTILAI